VNSAGGRGRAQTVDVNGDPQHQQIDRLKFSFINPMSHTSMFMVRYSCFEYRGLVMIWGEVEHSTDFIVPVGSRGGPSSSKPQKKVVPEGEPLTIASKSSDQYQQPSGKRRSQVQVRPEDSKDRDRDRERERDKEREKNVSVNSTNSGADVSAVPSRASGSNLFRKADNATVKGEEAVIHRLSGEKCREGICIVSECRLNRAVADSGFAEDSKIPHICSLVPTRLVPSYLFCSLTIIIIIIIFIFFFFSFFYFSSLLLSALRTFCMWGVMCLENNILPEVMESLALN
jgi:hypothetical protein